jgi:mxaJ protein
MYSNCHDVARVCDPRRSEVRPNLRAGGTRANIPPPACSEIGPYLRAVLLVLFVLGYFGRSHSLAAESERVLRVAADPNNLPFSNDRLEGFENRLAELVAHELGARLEYMWWPQRRGFFRETVGSGRADVVMGVPAGFERVLTTRPYYRSTYVFVAKSASPPVKSFDDPSLAQRIIGVQLIGDDFYNAPPAHALSARGMIDNIRGYTVYGDYGKDSPPSEIVKAVAAGAIDLAVAWGPMAGYYASRQSVPLAVTPVSPEQDGPTRPFTFAIAVGVRRGEQALRAEIDEVLERRRGDIDRLLDDFGVPRLPLQPAAEEARDVATH